MPIGLVLDLQAQPDRASRTKPLGRMRQQLGPDLLRDHHRAGLAAAEHAGQALGEHTLRAQQQRGR